MVHVKMYSIKSSSLSSCCLRKVSSSCSSTTLSASTLRSSRSERVVSFADERHLCNDTWIGPCRPHRHALVQRLGALLKTQLTGVQTAWVRSSLPTQLDMCVFHARIMQPRAPALRWSNHQLLYWKVCCSYGPSRLNRRRTKRLCYTVIV